MKPANVMMTEDGRVRVLDSGLAKLATQEGDAEETHLMTKDGMILGTVPYMSPKGVQGHAVDHRSDIFSLGIMFYEIATGSRRTIFDVSSDEQSLYVVKHLIPRMTHGCTS